MKKAKAKQAKVKQAKAPKQIKTVLDLVAVLDALPRVPPRGSRLHTRDDRDRLTRLRADMDRDCAHASGKLVDAVRDLLVPSYVAWVRAQETSNVPVFLDRAVHDAVNRVAQAEELRRRLVAVAPSLHALARDVQTVIESAEAVPDVAERPFSTRAQPGDACAFAVVVTPVDVVFHRTDRGFDVTYALHDVARGNFGAYGSDYAFQQRQRDEYPVLVGTAAETLWHALERFDADAATATVAAELRTAAIRDTESTPQSEDDAAAWNLEAATRATRLRAAAKALRESAEATATALEALAVTVSDETWPPERRVGASPA